MTASNSAIPIEAVLSIPELLEAILLSLDMVTLLVSAPRVSKRWYDIIAGSPAIRQALYFDPVPVKASSSSSKSGANDGSATIKPVLNPLLAKKFAPCFFDFGSKAYFRRANSFYSMPWTVKPRKEVLSEDGIMESLPLYPLLDPEGPCDQADRRRFTQRGASWRRMLVSQQPPLQLGHLWSDEQYRWHTLFWDAKVILNTDATHGGLRMGELYDLVQDHASDHQRHSLWFRVHWGQVRAPFFCDFSENASRQMICHTGVVVEFHEVDDVYQDHHRDPIDPDAFNLVFRCDEHRPLQIGVTGKPPTAAVDWNPAVLSYGWGFDGGVY
ncbi:hypothetical protein DL764_006823 [Monosporascus ibericus]|uniref:Uncharacterized protein n=1 Tax=Monosporascus ibericus TaxID=155417 RepID=A0A4Q4T3R4_9PEZI|nr:hypothetical protein DL764_006823 [Monosporascus ibericus]